MTRDDGDRRYIVTTILMVGFLIWAIYAIGVGIPNGLKGGHVASSCATTSTTTSYPPPPPCPTVPGSESADVTAAIINALSIPAFIVTFVLFLGQRNRKLRQGDTDADRS